MIKYVIYEAYASAESDADLNRVKVALVKSKRKTEISRFSLYFNAIRFLNTYEGKVCDGFEESKIHGYYLKAFEEDEEGNLFPVEEKKQQKIKIGPLEDERQKDKKDYFQDMEIRNDDYYYRFENRPRTTLEEGNRFDMDFINRILNKKVLDDNDKYNIANVVANIVHEYETENALFCEFEAVILKELGYKKYSKIYKKAITRHINKCLGNFEEK